MSAIQLTGSDRWEVVTPVTAGKEDQGVVHVPNSGIVTSNGQYVLPLGSLPSQPVYVTASGNEVAANGVSGIQYQVRVQKKKKIYKLKRVPFRFNLIIRPFFRSFHRSKTLMGHLQVSQRRDWMMAQGISSSCRMEAKVASESAVQQQEPLTS